MGKYVKVFTPDETTTPIMGENGQPFVYEVFSSGEDGTNPDSNYASALIVMKGGVVSAAHIHPEEEVVLVSLGSAPWGALTLSGDELQDADWIMPGQVKTIPALTPHIAIYPRSMPGYDIPDGALPDCRVIEIKRRPTWREDTFRRPELNRMVVERLTELELLDTVTLPHDLKFWAPPAYHLTGTREDVRP